jgi:cation transport regulator
MCGTDPSGAMERAMAYASNEDLPRSVRGHLPAHAQDIFRSALNCCRISGEPPHKLVE